MSKFKEDYYNLIQEYTGGNGSWSGGKIDNYIKELEQQNKEMLYILIVELKNDWIPWSTIGGSLDVFKIDHAYRINVIERITGKSIDEVLKDE